jgi:hypothetical protein
MRWCSRRIAKCSRAITAITASVVSTEAQQTSALLEQLRQERALEREQGLETRLRQLSSKSVLTRRRAALRRCLVTWCSVRLMSSIQNHFRRCLTVARRRRMLCRVVKFWRATNTVKKKRRKLLAGWCAHLRQKAARDMLQEWREIVVVHRRMQSLVVTLLARRHSHSLDAILLYWRSKARGQVELKKSALQIFARSSHHTVKAC